MSDLAPVRDARHPTDPANTTEVTVVLGPAGQGPPWPESAASLGAQDHRRTEVMTVPEPPLPVALHEGAMRADGELLMFCDGADEYATDRVSSFVRAWRASGRTDDFWGYSAVAFVDRAGAPVDLAASGLADLRYRQLLAAEEAWAPQLLRQHDLVLTPANLVVTPGLYRRIGGFRPGCRWSGWALALALLTRAQPVVIHRDLYRCRLDPVHGVAAGAGDGAGERAPVARLLGEQRARRRRGHAVIDGGIPFVDYLGAAGPLRGPYTGG